MVSTLYFRLVLLVFRIRIVEPLSRVADPAPDPGFAPRDKKKTGSDRQEKSDPDTPCENQPDPDATS